MTVSVTRVMEMSGVWNASPRKKRMTSFLLSPTDVASAYTDLRRRVIDLLTNQDPSVSDSAVPHCPNWTVKMALSHLVGVPEDVLSGNMEGVTTDAWTQAQVDRHVNHSLADLLDIWESLGNAIDGVVPHIPAPINHQFVFDAVTHEHDLRHALGQSGARESQAVHVAQAWFRNMLSNHHLSGAAVLLVSDVSAFDFVRSLSGRRTPHQIAACGLDASSVAEIVGGMPMSIPSHEVNE